MCKQDCTASQECFQDKYSRDVWVAQHIYPDNIITTAQNPHKPWVQSLPAFLNEFQTTYLTYLNPFNKSLWCSDFFVAIVAVIVGCWGIFAYTFEVRGSSPVRSWGWPCTVCVIDGNIEEHPSWATALRGTTCHQRPPGHGALDHSSLAMSIQPIPYPLGAPPFKSMSLQFGDPGCHWDCVTGLRCKQKSAQVTPAGLPLLSSPVTPSHRATSLVRHSLPFLGLCSMTFPGTEERLCSSPHLPFCRFWK